MALKVVFTRHARARMLLRGIDELTVTDIIMKPGAVEISLSGNKKASRRNGANWVVIYKEDAGKIVVLTVYEG